MVAYEGLGGGVEVNVAVQAAHVPHVLAFEVRGIGPFEQLYGDGVLAGVDVGGDVELGIVVSALGVAHIVAVDPQICSAVESVAVPEYAAAVPACGNLEGTAVGGHGAGTDAGGGDGGVWGIVREGIVHIYIYRLVISMHFDARGYGNGSPRTAFCEVRAADGVHLGVRGSQTGACHIHEVPGAVEVQIVRAFRCQPWFVVGGIGL